MTKITKEEVKYVAKLARIKIDVNELDKYSTDMQNIVSYIELLNEIDTSSINPTYQVSDNVNIMQADVVEAGLNREDVLSLAKYKDKVNFITKGVFNNE